MEKEHQLRSNQQNKSIHLYFTMVADALNDAGLDIKKAVEMDIPWTPILVKELLWRDIQRTMLKKESTTQLTTKEIDIVWEVLNRYLASLGIHEPFPSIESIMNAQLLKHDV